VRGTCYLPLAPIVVGCSHGRPHSPYTVYLHRYCVNWYWACSWAPWIPTVVGSSGICWLCLFCCDFWVFTLFSFQFPHYFSSTSDSYRFLHFDYRCWSLLWHSCSLVAGYCRCHLGSGPLLCRCVPIGIGIGTPTLRCLLCVMCFCYGTILPQV